MKRLSLLLFSTVLSIFLHLQLLGQQWLLPKEIGGTPIQDLIFFNDTIGLVFVNYDGIFRTTDGGNSWQRVYFTGNEACVMFDIQASGRVAAATSNFLFWSENFGQTWEQRDALNNMSYLKIQFIDSIRMVSFIKLQAKNAFAIGKSVDGGQS